MDQLRELLLDVWREVCRHLEIRESTVTITAMLARHLPVEALLVRRFSTDQTTLETVAWGSSGNNGFAIRQPRTPLPPTRLKRVLAWAGSGNLLRGRSHPPTSELALLAPEEHPGEALAGALMNEAGRLGVLAFYLTPKTELADAQLDFLRMLLEPFSAALENDHRLHELATLREAAEADKRSLLTRLGRRDTGETIVGADAGLRPVMERVELVSQSDVPVLILGETGTGKEVVSRAIHTRSKRAAAPFIRVNCGAIPTELIDSQLFGHERGSFTGAADTRKGWFERADGGTLFLDEIGELPLPAQVRLLRVLQDGFIERVGGQQPIRVDVRIIAATHRDLPGMVKSGTFREDLWYRIAIFPIYLPPLRDRGQDIPELARHFAERAANRFGLALVHPTSADLQILLNYAWPGNIRELGAVIDRAAILGDGKTLEVDKALGGNLPTTAIAGAAAVIAEKRTLPMSDLPPALPDEEHAPADPRKFDSLDIAMRKHIERALIATRGKIEGPHGAAALLGINPHTLRARMRKLQVAWSHFRGPRWG